MKKAAALLLAVVMLLSVTGCGHDQVDLSDVEKVSLWPLGIDLPEEESDKIIELYNQATYRGEATGEGGTPEYGFIIYFKNGSCILVQEFLGQQDFEVSFRGSDGKRIKDQPTIYLDNSELLSYVQELIEKY